MNVDDFADDGNEGVHQELLQKFGESGVKVQLTDNPAKKGTTTGNTKTTGSKLYVEVVLIIGSEIFSCILKQHWLH